jgi:hypothetical protein
MLAQIQPLAMRKEGCLGKTLKQFLKQSTSPEYRKARPGDRAGPQLTLNRPGFRGGRLI